MQPVTQNEFKEYRVELRAMFDELVIQIGDMFTTQREYMDERFDRLENDVRNLQHSMTDTIRRPEHDHLANRVTKLERKRA